MKNIGRRGDQAQADNAEHRAHPITQWVDIVDDFGQKEVVTASVDQAHDKQVGCAVYQSDKPWDRTTALTSSRDEWTSCCYCTVQPICKTHQVMAPRCPGHTGTVARRKCCRETCWFHPNSNGGLYTISPTLGAVLSYSPANLQRLDKQMATALQQHTTEASLPNAVHLTSKPPS